MTLGALVTGRIGALASGKVYCMQAPANPAAPYVIWRPISDVVQTSHDSFDGLRTALVQVDHYATTPAAADAMRAATVTAMCTAHDDTQPTDVGRMQYEDAITPALYNAQADFEITYAP